jgi:hypothetical protein
MKSGFATGIMSDIFDGASSVEIAGSSLSVYPVRSAFFVAKVVITFVKSTADELVEKKMVLHALPGVAPWHCGTPGRAPVAGCKFDTSWFALSAS